MKTKTQNKTQSKFHVKKGDKVVVISGASKKSEGIIQKIFVDKQTAIVEGLNMITKHNKPNAANPQGGIEKVEAPIHISNLKLIPQGESKPTRTGRRIEDGKLVRFSKASDKTVK